MIDLQIINPTPMPVSLVVANVSNSSSLTSSETPGPVSATSTRMLACSFDVETLTAAHGLHPVAKEIAQHYSYSHTTPQ